MKTRKKLPFTLMLAAAILPGIGKNALCKESVFQENTLGTFLGLRLHESR